ncbi:hypothetical protein [Breoghania sp.]|uniref:hypothetical protein n=1 Tax=Breoghania sp. TaxID=2065378 RepID=UPI0039EEDF27
MPPSERNARRKTGVMIGVMIDDIASQPVAWQGTAGGSRTAEMTNRPTKNGRQGIR